MKKWYLRVLARHYYVFKEIVFLIIDSIVTAEKGW